ncbi:MAG: hypothetical protein KatS3mg110_3879 [Pirellulaceae bacterium]|nr:MAG: hypothetical protein KatS3mg110_3879 [Pirellulaceae bacterium]
MAVATRTGTVTVNPAFLREVKEIHEELWQKLRECRCRAAEPVENAEEAAQFRQLLDELLERLARHFTVEETCGYFENPLEVAPHLATRCDQLRREHASLYLELLAIVDHADVLLDSGEAPRLWVAVQSAFIAFDDRLKAHEEAEAELIQAAFTQDFGGEG